MARSKSKKKGGGRGYQLVFRKSGPKSKYEDNDEFRATCQAYFRSLRIWNKPSISGICLWLGITRETWYQYKKTRKDLRETVDAVELAIETAWIDKLGSSYAAGAIFYLKNFRPDEWKDRSAGESPDNPIFTQQITGMIIGKDTGK